MRRILGNIGLFLFLALAMLGCFPFKLLGVSRGGFFDPFPPENRWRQILLLCLVLAGMWLLGRYAGYHLHITWR